MKRAGIIAFFLALLMGTGQAHACVGARALGMGGAFIGVADDITAVYWNPAGMANLQGLVFHSTITLSPIGERMGYREFYAAGETFGNMGAALSYIERLRESGILEKWYVISCGATLPSSPFLSMGTNLRYESHSDGTWRVQIDLGTLWQLDAKWKAGFLYQSLNNFRWGISYQANDTLKVSADIYNAFNNPRLLLGAEARYKSIAIRAGIYAGDPTIGIGYYRGVVQMDIAGMFRDDTIVLAGATLNY